MIQDRSSFATVLRRWLMATAFCSVLLAIGCGTATILAPQSISVTIPNKLTTIAPGAAATILTAVVQNDSTNSGVTWTLMAGGSICDPICGSLIGATASSVIYIPPATLPASPNDSPTITATSLRVATKFDTDNFPIALPASVTITGKVKAVQIGTSAITFHAVVANDPTSTGVTWFLSQVGNPQDCTPACGSLRNATATSVVYTPPVSVPGIPGNRPTLSASLTSNSIPYGDLDTFDIISGTASGCAGAPTGHESRMNGQYAFFAQGFNSSAVALAASFAADGTGKIADLGGGTGGAFDLNTSNAAQSLSILSTGSLYRVGADPTGAGDLGCLQLATSDGFTTIFQFSLSAPAGGIATRGKIIEFDDQSGDGTGTRLTGVLMKQDPTAFSNGDTSQLHTEYAFGVDGMNSGNGHIAVAGRLTLDPPTGAITSSVFDADDGINFQHAVTNGTGTISSISAKTGRALLLFSTPAPSFWSPSANPTQAAIYIVNANEFFIATLDPPTSSSHNALPGAKYSGRAIVSAASFASNPLSGNFILHQSGIAAFNGVVTAFPCASATLGLITLTPGGAALGKISGTLYAYNLQAGASFTSLARDSYAIDLTTGRITIYGGAGATPPIFYVTAPASNTENISAFAIGTDPADSFGLVEPGAGQAVVTSTLVGNYFFADEDPADSSITDRGGVLAISATGAATGTENDSDPLAGPQTKATSGTFTIDNSEGPGTGNYGADALAITNGNLAGTKIFFMDETSGSPASIRVVEKQ
jgi:hypothetical protein